MTGTSQAEDLEFEAELDPDNDQYFLLFFIMGTYFGPDIKGESPQKSILQRVMEGLPPYTHAELGGSHMKIAEIEQVFRYVLRKTSQSAKALLPLLPQFCNGDLPRIGEEQSPDYPQLPDLFPLELHPHRGSDDGGMVIENIGFTSDPEVYHLGIQDVERFRRLSGLEDFFLDAEALRSHISRVGELNGLNGESSTEKTRRIDELLQQNDHAMVLLPSIPTKSDLSNLVSVSKRGFAVAGSAAKGKLGSSIGLMDIGECDDSYLFRISLPGVKRDAKDFSCVVEDDGKVVIRGVNSAGENMVYRYSNMFVMQTQNLCPSGRFSISFKLPGPVDPQQFSGNFDSDGILEGIVMKNRSQTAQ